MFEVQSIRCRADVGSFVLSFRGGTSQAISFDAPAVGGSSVKEAIEGIHSIGAVDVEYSSGTQACQNGNIITVTFKSNFGDLPLMIADSTGLGGVQYSEQIVLIHSNAPLTSGTFKLQLPADSVSFRLEGTDISKSWSSETTTELSYDISAGDMRAALENAFTVSTDISSVTYSPHVSKATYRSKHSDGYAYYTTAWTIRFTLVSARLPRLQALWNSGAENECADCTAFSSSYDRNPYLQVETVQRLAGAMPVFFPQREIQLIKLYSQSDTIGIGTFKISMTAYRKDTGRTENCVTKELQYSASENDVETALNMLCNFGNVEVSRAHMSLDSKSSWTNQEITHLTTWLITFLDYGGSLSTVVPLWYNYGCSTCTPFAKSSSYNSHLFPVNMKYKSPVLTSCV
jgi:hypothetical protein